MSFIEDVYGRGDSEPIGRDVLSGRNVYLNERELSTYLIGAPGMGKSTALLAKCLDDLKRNDSGLILIDPHGDLARDFIEHCPPEHADRVMYFSPAEQQDVGWAFNPFEWHNPEEATYRLGAVLSVFKYLFYGDLSQTPVMHSTIDTLLRTLFAAYPQYQTHFAHMLMLVRGSKEALDWQQALAAVVKDDPIVGGQWTEWSDKSKNSVWREETKTSKAKIRLILSNPIIRPILSQPVSSIGFQFEEMLSSKRAIIVNLSGIEEEEAWRLVGALFLSQIVAMAYARSSQPRAKRVPFKIYCDEFHNFVPQYFSIAIAQLRKYGAAVNISHQSLHQKNMTPEARAAALSCGHKLVFRVDEEDARILNPMFVKDRTFPVHGLANMRRHEAMVKYEEDKEVYQVRIETIPTSEPVRPEVAAAIRQAAYTYARPAVSTPFATPAAADNQASPAKSPTLSEKQPNIPLPQPFHPPPLDELDDEDEWSSTRPTI